MDPNASAMDCFEHGRSLLVDGDEHEALECFRAAHAREPGNARFRSFYGLCLGLVERKFDESVELCRSAAKQEFFNPDQYLNLARLHMAFGFKSEGLRYLRRGRMIDPAHDGIAQEMSGLGRRSQPVLRFLPRRHALNRWLGAARHLVSRRTTQRAAA